MRSWESSDLVKLPAEWIKSGLDHCRSNEPWPPNCAQFIAICKPTAEKLGLLTADQAYHCATHDRVDNLDTATRLAAKNTGYYELRTLSKEKTWPLFKRNYEVVVRRILNGENLSADIPKGLPERPCEPSPSKDEIASARADILKFIAKNR